VGAGAQHVGAGAQHDDLQQLFLKPQRASAVPEQRTRPAEHTTAAAANFIMILSWQNVAVCRNAKTLGITPTAGEG
jgi:hypothetical protein